MMCGAEEGESVVLVGVIQFNLNTAEMSPTTYWGEEKVTCPDCRLKGNLPWAPP
jgi:hypothetical protein